MLLNRLEKILLFLTILFLPTQLGRHFWPDFSFIYSLKIDYLSPTIYFWDLLVGILLIKGWSRINLTALNLLLAFLLSQLIALIPATSPTNIGVGLVRFEQYLVAGLFGVYLASLNFAKIKSVIFWALTLAILGQSFLALAQFVKGETLGFWILGERTFSISTPAIAKFDFYGTQFLRPYATFPHPNVLAAFLVLSVALCFALRAKKELFLFSTTAFLGIVALVLTVSRVAIAVGVVSAFVLLPKRWFIWILLVVILASPFLYPRFAAVLNFDNLTLLRREELSKLALQIWAQSPLFGVGLNNFILSSAESLVVGPGRFLQPVHNIFLLSLAETGVLGLLGLLGLIGYSIFRLINQGSILKTKHFALMWVVIIFLGMFDHYFLTLPQGYRMLFLIWGLSLSTISSKITTNAKSS
ncbi:hypothetical protein A3B45_02620 [Candidatus Daviesbacteria bacterium RIFCSPLOWO2_01_FULL_39_12]|uniref:O-antigen ligase-related domain-containing protein n=1 Tax=Candidatus Daviesbacteria bacterium RIFCSPLOWO2_01_FULL_39_12 TaxID=1797785 RepID=A0A1F5KSU8_9BACT|nr:MAG: hypothetical protein A3B45_02620 [Candidatus Daviesbacteria bacterium RIFCSPLOWO2_01_FULL_39_12]